MNIKFNDEIFSYEKFLYPGLKEHNKSVLWIKETAEEICAKITVIEKKYTNYDKFQILLNGKYSGVLYKIEGEFNLKIADLLSNRINQLSINNDNFMTIKRIFSNIFKFNVYWYDIRVDDWTYICIDDENTTSWPGDTIVSLMNALYNDIFTSLDKKMYTLRGALIDSFPTYWFRSELPNNILFGDICKFTDELKIFHETREDSESKKLLINLKNWIGDNLSNKKNNDDIF